MTSRDIPTLPAILFCRLAILGPFLWAFGAGRIGPAVAKVSNLMRGHRWWRKANCLQPPGPSWSRNG